VTGGLGIITDDDAVLQPPPELFPTGVALPETPTRSCWKGDITGDGSFLSITLAGGDTLLLPVLEGAGGGGEHLDVFTLLGLLPGTLEGLELLEPLPLPPPTPARLCCCCCCCC